MALELRGYKKGQARVLTSESRELREVDHLQHEHSGSQKWCVERLLEGKMGSPSWGGWWEPGEEGGREDSSPFVGPGTASRGQCCTAMG